MARSWTGGVDARSGAGDWNGSTSEERQAEWWEESGVLEIRAWLYEIGEGCRLPGRQPGRLWSGDLLFMSC